MRRFVWLLGALLLATTPGFSVLAQGGLQDAASQKALAYVRTQQAPDGTFAGFGAGSTADAIYALVAAHANPAEVKKGQASAIDGLVKLAPEAVKDAGVAAKFVLAALLSRQNPRALGGKDLVASLEQGYSAATARYGKDVTSHVLVLLALRSAGVTVQPEAIAALEKLQLPDGGWSFDGTSATGSDTNTTALAFQTLISTGGSGQARQKALAYLHAQQNADGGFPYSQTSKYGNASDANSTALSLQAITASGEPLTSWAKNGKTPLDRLLAFQNPSGAFRFQDAQPADNQLATYQAIPAVEGKPFPLEAIAVAQPAQTSGPELNATAATAATATMMAETAEARAQPILAAPTPTGSAPVRLPATGASPLPFLPVLLFGLAIVAAGLLARRRHA